MSDKLKEKVIKYFDSLPTDENMKGSLRELLLAFQSQVRPSIFTLTTSQLVWSFVNRIGELEQRNKEIEEMAKAYELVTQSHLELMDVAAILQHDNEALQSENKELQEQLKKSEWAPLDSHTELSEGELYYVYDLDEKLMIGLMDYACNELTNGSHLIEVSEVESGFYCYMCFEWPDAPTITPPNKEEG